MEKERERISNLSQEEFAKEFVKDVIISEAKTYPVPYVRGCLKRLMDQKQIVVAQKLAWEEFADFAVIGPNEKGRSQIVLNFPYLAQICAKASKQVYNDFLIVICLHMQFALENPSQLENSNEYDPQQHVQNQKTLWWYMCKEVILPSQQAGRMNHFTNDGSQSLAVEAYKKANGDQDSKIWMAFSYHVAGQISREEFLKILGE